MQAEAPRIRAVNAFAASLQQLRQDGLLSDVELELSDVDGVPGAIFHAHRVVLAAHRRGSQWSPVVCNDLLNFPATAAGSTPHIMPLQRGFPPLFCVLGANGWYDWSSDQGGGPCISSRNSCHFMFP